MKFSLFFVSFLLFTTFVYAHVKAGSYNGFDADGKPCSFTVGPEYFEGQKAHPLNERIPVVDIKFEGVKIIKMSWALRHPPVVNVEKGLVRFDHDIFQNQEATQAGGVSVTLLKDPAETPGGRAPLGLLYIEDHYSKRELSQNLRCNVR